MTKNSNPIIVWIRKDLRIHDNPALMNACMSERPTIIVYIDEDGNDDCYSKQGGASRWFLHHALNAFNADLENCGGTLLFFKGDAQSILDDIIKKTKADTLYWNRRYEPFHIKTDTKIKEHFSKQDIHVESFPGNVLVEPMCITNKQKKPFEVFTPFCKTLLNQDIAKPLPSITNIISHPFHDSLKCDDLKLLPQGYDWSKPLTKEWRISEKDAQKRLDDFLNHHASDYHDLRNRPDFDGTSKLSPFFHFGMLSVKQAFHQTLLAQQENSNVFQGTLCFLQELGWRDFSYHQLFHKPFMPHKNIKTSFDHFLWNDNAQHLTAWQKGLTGYPIVDAGMRQLWQTGWMHNRVRMIVASFLIKDLLLDWRQGQLWFWDTLVDADLASNAASWQWVAGSGADAAPYFRIFNPILQSQKFDPEGDFIKTFVPELSRLDARFIHTPWQAPQNILKDADVILGENYPHPIVQHDAQKKIALMRYQMIKGKL